MRRHRPVWILTHLAAALISICSSNAFSAEPNAAMPEAQTNFPIDLPTALRLAGAQNLDVQMARQRSLEAEANYQSARLQFLPWLSPGAGFRRHEDRIQDVVGNILDADKQSYTAGATLTAQWDLGEAIYKALAAKQLASAANSAVAAQRQESALTAAQAYFDLSFAQLAIAVADEALRISRDYEAQVQRAVEAGLAFKGDALRVQVQTERNEVIRRQAEEQRGLTSARLAQIIRLNPSIQLMVREPVLSPLNLISTNTALAALINEALAHRPELAQNASLVAAAQQTRKAASYGPLIPSVGAQAFVGGLGGGRENALGEFGRSEDYAVTLGWKIGPGGLLDFSRKQSADARLSLALLGQEKARNEIAKQVVEAFTRFHSLADQIVTTQRALAAAESSLRLAQQRKEFAVGVVLETIQAEQDLTRLRLDYLRVIADFNKSQYALQRSLGGL